MTPRRAPVRLLPRDVIVSTGEVDQADWNFHPLLGPVQRGRFQAVVDLLGGRRYGRLLEIGYGSGVFMPELARHCDGLFGLDPHPKRREVEAVLEQQGLEVSLRTGRAESIPFEDAYFDAVVAVSSMEYVLGIDDACVEIGRVLATGGIFVLVTPGHSKVLDLALWILTRESARQQYGDRRQGLIEVIPRHFSKADEATDHTISSPLLTMYTALKLRPRDAPS